MPEVTPADLYNLACIREIVEGTLPSKLMIPELLAKMRADYATLAKLPRYADTGEAFVPGVDEAWVVLDRGEPPREDGPRVSASYCEPRFIGRWTPDDYQQMFWTGKFYSTKAAAESAAREATK